VVSFRRAIVLVLAGKATIVADGPTPVVGGSMTLPRPTVILLGRYVRAPHGRAVPVSRRGVLRRRSGRRQRQSDDQPESRTAVPHHRPPPFGGHSNLFERAG